MKILELFLKMLRIRIILTQIIQYLILIKAQIIKIRKVKIFLNKAGYLQQVPCYELID